MFSNKIVNLLMATLLTFFLTACSSTNQIILEKKEITPTLINEVIQITHLINQNNLTLLNSKYVNANYGIYEVSKVEGKNTFEHKNSILALKNNIDSFEVKNEEVTFNCSPLDDSLYGWNKEGLYLNMNTKPFLVKIMNEMNIINANTYKEEELKKANFIENFSYAVTIPYNIIFYITKIDNKWYITLIDNVTTDCSE